MISWIWANSKGSKKYFGLLGNSKASHLMVKYNVDKISILGDSTTKYE